MLLQTVLRFYISLRETFATLIACTWINKYGKGAVVHISTVFWPVYHVISQRDLFLLDCFRSDQEIW